MFEMKHCFQNGKQFVFFQKSDDEGIISAMFQYIIILSLFKNDDSLICLVEIEFV